MKLHTLAALLASTIAAAAVAAPSTATSTLPPGVKDMSPDQIDYNLQAIDAAAKEQQELARQKEAARAAAQAAAQEAAAKEKAAAEKRAAAAARAKAQQQAAAAKEKAARQAKLDAYEDKVRELELQMKELDVTERRAQVEGTVSDAAARSELSREKAQVELDRMKAEVEALPSKPSIAKAAQVRLRRAFQALRHPCRSAFFLFKIRTDRVDPAPD